MTCDCVWELLAVIFSWHIMIFGKKKGFLSLDSKAVELLKTNISFIYLALECVICQSFNRYIGRSNI